MATPAHSLVTGANRGLGLALVRGLLARGDRVVATARHPGKATALNTLTGEYPGRLHVLPLDVASDKSREELARELPLVLDDARLSLLINNAGVLHSGERWGKLQRRRGRRQPAHQCDRSAAARAGGGTPARRRRDGGEHFDADGIAGDAQRIPFAELLDEQGRAEHGDGAARARARSRAGSRSSR